MFPQFPVAFELIDTYEQSLADIQFLVELIWTVFSASLNRGPDALLSVAQIVRCVTETPQLTSRFGSSAIVPFAFLPSAAVVTRKGITNSDPIRCIPNVQR